MWLGPPLPLRDRGLRAGRRGKGLPAPARGAGDVHAAHGHAVHQGHPPRHGDDEELARPLRDDARGLAAGGEPQPHEAHPLFKHVREVWSKRVACSAAVEGSQAQRRPCRMLAIDTGWSRLSRSIFSDVGFPWYRMFTFFIGIALLLDAIPSS